MSKKSTDGMAEQPQAPDEEQKPDGPQKPWRRGAEVKLKKAIQESLYQVYFQLNKETRQEVGLMMQIPVFIKDPLIALQNPLLGVQEIAVRLEVGMGDGPTSSRAAVVDFNADSQTLIDPVAWDEKEGWFRGPAGWLPDPPDIPADATRAKDLHAYEAAYRDFIEKVVKDPHYHQVNVWAVVHRVLEFYEEPWAMGRPIPWGFDGNRLLIVPHAGYGENAFYDQHSKSLQFYYFGDRESPGYTCLSHDIITHETGHAVLDGIRPMYNQLCSLQTAAFHEFIGDLTAILLALFNQDIRHHVSRLGEDWLEKATVLADLAPEFGQEVEGRPYLRTAFNRLTMSDVAGSLSPHTVSQVMTGAMWEILTGIAAIHLQKNAAPKDPDDDEPDISAAQALWYAADRFRRIALQPLDLCPPCDIRFIDYARAVIRNDILTNPVDARGYRPAMLAVFHRRGLCACGYKPGEDLPAECLFNEGMFQERLDLVYHDIERISRSRMAAYYFLSDNRKPLRIPAHQDVRVVDLYDTNKYGAAAERLPREVVLEYAWQEVVVLEQDAGAGLDFGAWNGKTFNLDCGGTLVFDGRGNLHSWFRKPGTEHIGAEEEAEILARKAAWENDADQAREDRIKWPTRQELARLEDLALGRQRKKELLGYLSALVRRGLVGSAAALSRFNDGLSPVAAVEEGGSVRFEATPHLRKSDFDQEEAGWPLNY